MTDNEIIKALERCINGKCNECPLRAMNCSPKVAMAFSVDLINRQKAEIERLKVLSEQLGKDVDVKLKYIYELEAINESMKEDKPFIIAEAIKEFAERLKESAIDADVYSGYRKELFEKAVTVIEIDRILEEMTEEI